MVWFSVVVWCVVCVVWCGVVCAGVVLCGGVVFGVLRCDVWCCGV